MTTSLVLLLPLLVLAVVVLFAFAGCFTKPDPPHPPSYPDEIGGTGGLVAYWRLGEGTLPTALDQTTAHLDGTYQGGVSLLAEAGALEKIDGTDRAPDFNGQDSYVEVAWDMRLNPVIFTVEAWIRPAVGGQGTQHVVASRDTVGGLALGYELSVIRPPDPNPRIEGRVCTGVASPDLAVEVVLERSDAQLVGIDWTYVALTYDGLAADKPATLYVDGAAVATKTNVPYTQNANRPLRIGAGRTIQQPAPAEFYAGGIDEVAIYNVALSADVVQAHYHASGR